jgi:3',5'-cyclic AMP phosphodiesterase CpdA
MPFCLGHVTDVHVTRVDALRPGQWLGKRAGGAANALLGRGRYGSSAILDAVAADVRAEPPDHVAVTGDLTQLSLAAEFEGARALVDSFGLGPEHVSVIPGNHDCYARDVVDERLFERAFAPYLGGQAWPILKVDGRVAVVGLSTAVPTPLLFATGTLGAEQVARLDELLARAEVRERTVVLLVHHPILRRVQKMNGRLRGLTDAPALLEVIARRRVDLVLHGHEHRRLRYAVPTLGGSCPVVGAGSASRLSAERARGAQYNRYWLEDRKLLRVETREYDAVAARFLPVDDGPGVLEEMHERLA